MCSRMISAIARGGWPSARAIASARLVAMSPWAGSRGASSPIAEGSVLSLPSACALASAVLSIARMISFIGWAGALPPIVADSGRRVKAARAALDDAARAMRISRHGHPAGAGGLMDLGLEGKVAIVTGGSKGIGRATALRLLEEGARVLACARGREALEETAALARRSEAGRLTTLQADMGKPADIAMTVERALAAFGRIDILVNNAGSARLGRLAELSD